MKITYQITEKLQKKLASEGQDAKKDREVELENTEVADHILGDSRVEINKEGNLSMDVSKEALYAYGHKNIYAGGEDGHAKGRVSWEDYYLYTAPNFRNMKWDFLIETALDLGKAVNILKDQNDLERANAQTKTQDSLDSFRERVDQYNEEYREKELVELREQVKRLKTQNNLLQVDKNRDEKEIEESLIKEIIEIGYIDREEDTEIRYIISKEDY